MVSAVDRVLAFPLFFFRHFVLHRQLDHVHPKYGLECSLCPIKYSFERSALVAQDYNVVRSHVSPRRLELQGTPFSFMPSLRIAALLKSQASAYLTSFLTNWSSADSGCLLSSSSSSSSPSPSVSEVMSCWRCVDLCASSSSWDRISQSAQGRDAGAGATYTARPLH